MDTERVNPIYTLMNKHEYISFRDNLIKKYIECKEVVMDNSIDKNVCDDSIGEVVFDENGIYMNIAYRIKGSYSNREFVTKERFIQSLLNPLSYKTIGITELFNSEYKNILPGDIFILVNDVESHFAFGNQNIVICKEYTKNCNNFQSEWCILDSYDYWEICNWEHPFCKKYYLQCV